MKTSNFAKYVEGNRQKMGRELLHKAFIANRLAKSNSGVARRRLYALKYRYLTSAIRILPNSFYFDSEVRVGVTTILGLRSTEGFAFHIPAEELNADTLGIISRSSKCLGGVNSGRA